MSQGPVGKRQPRYIYEVIKEEKPFPPANWSLPWTPSEQALAQPKLSKRTVECDDLSVNPDGSLVFWVYGGVALVPFLVLARHTYDEVKLISP